jgi:hypothetical protein
MMIPENIFKALKVISDKLNGKGINWVLISSTNQALQGVDVKPRDIDILTDKEGVYAIVEALKDFVVEAVHPRESETMKSHYGKLNIEGVEVEIIGDLINIKPKGDLWSETKNFSKKIIIEFKGVEVPGISLDQELSAYTKMKNIERIKKIKQAMD